MVIPPDEPRRELTTEHVPTGRRAAIAVVVVAVLVVGALLWKPWQTESRAPAAALPAALPAVPATSTPTVPPSPVVAQVRPTNPPPPPIDLARVELSTVSGPFITCDYATTVAGRQTLIQMGVSPPIVPTDPAAFRSPIGTVEWVASVEVNEEEHLFSADWLPFDPTVWSTREATVDPVSRVTFWPLTVPSQATKAHRTQVFRVAITVTWSGPDGDQPQTRILYPATYGLPNGTAAPDGCPGWLTTRGSATN